jgi:glycosyltransferase involved in cell wall biosynthesis
MSKFTKILYVIGNLDIGGAERHLVKILPKLAQDHFQIQVYTLTHRGKQASLLEASGISVCEPYAATLLRTWPKRLRQAVLLPLTLLSLCTLVLRQDPDILHFFLPVPYVLGGFCSLLTGRRIRVMSRRSLNRYHSQQPWLARLEKWMHPRMDAILGNSQAIVDELAGEGVAGERLGLIYNGVAPPPHPSLRAQTRAQLGLAAEDWLLVCVANLTPYKGHADLLQALAAIQSRLPQGWRLGLAGRDSGYGAALRGLAESLGIAGHILWLGERGDVPALYQACDVGILCSHEEGFPNSLLEGMAAGAPMIATAVGGNGEAVLDGVSGLLAPPQDSAKLGQAILTLANDAALRAKLGAAGRERAERLFSLEACAQSYARLYRALMSDPGKPIRAMLRDADDPIEPQP